MKNKIRISRFRLRAIYLILAMAYTFSALAIAINYGQSLAIIERINALQERQKNNNSELSECWQDSEQDFKLLGEPNE